MQQNGVVVPFYSTWKLQSRIRHFVSKPVNANVGFRGTCQRRFANLFVRTRRRSIDESDARASCHWILGFKARSSSVVLSAVVFIIAHVPRNRGRAARNALNTARAAVRFVQKRRDSISLGNVFRCLTKDSLWKALKIGGSHLLLAILWFWHFSKGKVWLSMVFANTTWRHAVLYISYIGIMIVMRLLKLHYIRQL